MWGPIKNLTEEHSAECIPLPHHNETGTVSLPAAAAAAACNGLSEVS